MAAQKPKDIPDVGTAAALASDWAFRPIKNKKDYEELNKHTSTEFQLHYFSSGKSLSNRVEPAVRKFAIEYLKELTVAKFYLDEPEMEPLIDALRVQVAPSFRLYRRAVLVEYGAEVLGHSAFLDLMNNFQTERLREWQKKKLANDAKEAGLKKK